MPASKHATRGPDGKFVRSDGTTKKRKGKRRPAGVASVAMQRFADKARRQQYTVDRRGDARQRKTIEALLSEFGDQQPPASAAMLAERIARNREQLTYYDAVMVEFRERNLLVDRKRRQLRRIQAQYSALNAEFRADLVAWNQLKQGAQLDEIHAAIEEIRSAGGMAREVQNRRNGS